MAKRAETGVFQVKNGQWGYRFTLQIEGKRISRRKFTDADGNKLLSKKQAQNNIGPDESASSIRSGGCN